ncbi:MAG: imidazoleglycerol-phosphate dehydratase [Nitrososphaerota archaeon]
MEAIRRRGSFSRSTKETEVEVSIVLDGTGVADVSTGLRFLDHMLHLLAHHTRSDLTVRARWDLVHHGVEDVAIALGRAVGEALGDRKGIRRFGHALVPMDESLALAAVDLVRRAHASVDLTLSSERIEDVAAEDLQHFVESFAVNVPAVVHVEVLRGTNAHHKVEAAFKALALALRDAWSIEPGFSGPRSTKGVL